VVAIGVMLSGLVAYFNLPIAPLPSVELPTIMISAGQPGADPATMASSVAAPLERQLGAIAGVSEMTSTSLLGGTTIIMQFDLSRSIEGAARDVQAAINAAASELPAGLATQPYFRKANPGEAPVLIMAMTSDTVPASAVYDAADSLVAPRIAQIPGVAEVRVAGSEQPAVRVTVDPAAARAAGVGLEAIRQAINQNNVTQPTGLIDGTSQSAAITVNDRLNTAEDFGRIILRSADGAIVRISSVARVEQDVRDRRQGGSVDGRAAVMMIVLKQPDANVIQVVDDIRGLMPQVQRWLPGDVTVRTIRDRSVTIRASVNEVQHALLISIALVIGVVALFLGHGAAVAAAAASVPLSLLGTLAAMWMLGYSLNNLSLMALTISVGFVVDDAIVMIENMTRLRERGMKPMAAAYEGARQIGFTVVSITVSLIAVFIPLLFMGGIIGRMFREFSATLAIAVAISGVVSLTVTPMMAAHLASATPRPPGRVARLTDAGMTRLTNGYMWSLGQVLRFRRVMLVATVALIGVTAWLYTVVPKGFFPQQDTGLIVGYTRASPDVSYQAMLAMQERVVALLMRDPAVASTASQVGGGGGFAASSQGRIFVSLKPLAERDGVSAREVIDRLRPALSGTPGMQTFLNAVQDVNIGGRSGNAQFQFVLLSPDLEGLATWSENLLQKLRTLPGITDVSSDQDRVSPVTRLTIDREAAARLGVSVAAVATALNNGFSQRQVSMIYRARNQYRVVLELEPDLQQFAEQVDDIWVPGTGGTQVPLSSLVTIGRDVAPVRVTHQGQYPAATLSFNLAPDMSLGEAAAAVEQAAREIGLPDGMRTEFAGSARTFQTFARDQPLLILAAVLSIYLVLGMLYEHLLHPVTIISTLPTAGIGALLALLVTDTPFTVIALIGVILLMGIVKKNAIMMVDFALEHERTEGIGGLEAITTACRERFRPILMTTLAAVFGAVPLAFGTGAGAELRQPLGIAIIGGLLMSQLLTLYTTPVVYLALDGLGRKRRPRLAPAPAE
jgi:multidrug efflux pump